MAQVDLKTPYHKGIHESQEENDGRETEKIDENNGW